MPKITGMTCCKCGTSKSPYWHRYYDDNNNQTKKRICYDCKLEIEKEKNRKIKERRSPNQNRISPDAVCYRCGQKAVAWERDSKGITTGNLICRQCYNFWHRYGTYEKYKTRRVDHTNTRCYICGSNKTYIRGIDSEGKEIYDWRKDKDGNYICSSCRSNINKKSERLWRMGLISRYIETGVGIVGQYIVAKTIRVDDLNIINDNLRQPVDLSEHSIYGISDVKIATLADDNRWTFGTVFNRCDTVFYVGMDRYVPWKDVEMVCAAPCDLVFKDSSISIFNDIPKGRKWDILQKYRIDKKPFNDTYHNVDIPEFFNPIDLWEGRYDKR